MCRYIQLSTPNRQALFSSCWTDMQWVFSGWCVNISTITSFSQLWIGWERDYLSRVFKDWKYPRFKCVYSTKVQTITYEGFKIWRTYEFLSWEAVTILLEIGPQSTPETNWSCCQHHLKGKRRKKWSAKATAGILIKD